MAKKDSGKSPKVNRWVNLIGDPGQHGDVIRIGFGDGKWYLEITNDGFPHGNAGGMLVPIPDSVMRGSRLDARKFLEFYRSVYPGGEPIYDFSNPIWIYQPTPGRPLYSLIEDYHVFYLSNLKMVSQLLNPEKPLAYAAKSPAYRYVERGTGVLF